MFLEYVLYNMYFAGQQWPVELSVMMEIVRISTVKHSSNQSHMAIETWLVDQRTEF